MVALQAALLFLASSPAIEEDPIIVCTDSQSALARLRSGAAAQTSPLGVEIWEALKTLADNGSRPVRLQWVPSHCAIPGNERADVLAKEASLLDQEDVSIDVRTAFRAAARAAKTTYTQEWPPGWYRDLMGTKIPPPVTGVDRDVAVDVHQVRAGHWSGSVQYMHRIGRSPQPNCDQCDQLGCRAGLCPLCREEADTPRHILLRCPAHMRLRFDLLSTINPTTTEVRGSEVVAALVAARRRLQSRLGYAV